MLKHFPSEKDRTRHQGQSHLTPSGCLCVMRRKRDQAASAAPNSCPAAARREGRQEELAGSPDVRATPSPPPPGCRVRGALPGGALSTARSQKLRQKEQHNAFLLLLPRRGRGSPPAPAQEWERGTGVVRRQPSGWGGVPHTWLPRLNAGVNPHGRRPEGRFIQPLWAEPETLHVQQGPRYATAAGFGTGNETNPTSPENAEGWGSPVRLTAAGCSVQFGGWRTFSESGPCSHLGIGGGRP